MSIPLASFGNIFYYILYSLHHWEMPSNRNNSLDELFSLFNFFFVPYSNCMLFLSLSSDFPLFNFFLNCVFVSFVLFLFLSSFITWFIYFFSLSFFPTFIVFFFRFLFRYFFLFSSFCICSMFGLKYFNVTLIYYSLVFFISSSVSWFCQYLIWEILLCAPRFSGDIWSIWKWYNIWAMGACTSARKATDFIFFHVGILRS